MFPNRQILLYFIFPIKAKYFVLLFGVFELLAARGSMMGHVDGIGHFAHLGGMLFGYLFLAGGLGGRSRSWGLGNLGSWWRRQRTKARIRVVRPDDRSRPSERQERIDAILEKISREGLESLTPEEADILRKASRRH
jgi:hypothetical protein